MRTDHGKTEIYSILRSIIAPLERQVAELSEQVSQLIAATPAKAARPVVTLGQLVAETIATARAQNVRPRYLDQLSYVLCRFVKGRETLPITAITLDVIEQWLASQKGRNNGKASPATIRGLKNRIGAMFSEAERKQYILPHGNPMRRVLTPKVDPGEIIFLKVIEAHHLLWVCRVTDLEFLPYLTIGMFAGVRPEELEKLPWRVFDLERGIIVIDEFVSKVRQRRLVEMEPLLIEWLKWWFTTLAGKWPTAYVVPIDGDRKTRVALIQTSRWVRRHRRKLYLRAGVKPASDILRKTAATYLMAKHENENKVSLLLGNSPTILFRHYRGLVRREENEAFWALTPSVVKNEPIALPKGGQGKKKPGKLI